MVSRNIPRDQWSSFLRRFAEQHQGWLVRIETDEGSAETAVEPLRLRSIAAEQDGDVTIEGDSSEGGRTTFTVTAPCRVTLAQAEGDRDLGLEIESARGGVTQLRFRVPTHPGLLNGV